MLLLLSMMIAVTLVVSVTVALVVNDIPAVGAVVDVALISQFVDIICDYRCHG